MNNYTFSFTSDDGDDIRHHVNALEYAGTLCRLERALADLAAYEPEEGMPTYVRSQLKAAVESIKKVLNR
jgi:hypothetical protein